MNSKNMNQRYSIAEARDNLAAIVHKLEKTDKIELTRRGQPVAVLLSTQEFNRLQSRHIGFWQAYKKYTKQVNLAELAIDPAKVFGELRDKSPGRQAKW